VQTADLILFTVELALAETGTRTTGCLSTNTIDFMKLNGDATQRMPSLLADGEPAIPDYRRQYPTLITPLERDILHKRVQNDLALISSLPNELLSAIFEAGSPSPPSHPGKLPFEVLVSHVSRHWRHVAINTPRLWTEIAPHRFNMANTYLQRSKVTPLNLFVDLDFEIHTQDHITSICHLITPHVGRWHRIHVVCNWCEGLNAFLDSLPSAAPLLRCIKIHYSKRDVWEQEPFEFDLLRLIFIDGTPSLTSLLLNGVTLQNYLPPLTSIIDLQLHHPRILVDGFILRHMLTGLPRLTHLVFNDLVFDIAGWGTVGTIELLSLRSLHIYTHDADGLICGLMTSILAPLLQSLLVEAVSSPWASRDFTHTIGLTSVSHNYPSLHSLTIRPFRMMCLDVWHSSSPWMLFMQAFPTVKHFTLWFDDVDAFLCALNEQIYPPNSSVASLLWPELNTLTLISQSQYPIITRLRTAVFARIASGRSIPKFQLSESIMEMLADDLEWLRERAEVEKSTMYEGLGSDSPFIRWPERDDDEPSSMGAGVP
jgi:hypothetical protein